MTASATRIGGMTARMGLVCGSSLDAYEVLWVQEGPLATIDDKILYVKKERNNE